MELGDPLDASPSLKRYPAENLPRAYASARLLTAKETGIDSPLFPTTSPFTIDEILDEEFWPGGSDLDPYPTQN